MNWIIDDSDLKPCSKAKFNHSLHQFWCNLSQNGFIRTTTELVCLLQRMFNWEFAQNFIIFSQGFFWVEWTSWLSGYELSEICKIWATSVFENNKNIVSGFKRNQVHSKLQRSYRSRAKFHLILWSNCLLIEFLNPNSSSESESSWQNWF